MAERIRRRRFILQFLSIISCVAALLATIWIVIPAPAFQIWLVSVLASEWSLGFAALALFGIVLSWLSGGRTKSRWRRLVSLIGGCAIALALYPLGSAWLAARDAKVELSFFRYVSGFWRDSNFGAINKPDFSTHTFAVIDETELRLDAYQPIGKSTGAGVIVVHGGSWNGGARGDFPAWNQWLANEGYTVFDVDYRLTQPNWATATGDIKCAVIWIKSHAAEFRVSPEKLVLLGRSAGGQLALLAAYTAGDKDFPASCPNAEFDSAVKAVISFYAPTDLLWAFEHPANRRVINGPETLRQFLGGSPSDSDEMRERYQAASPLSHVSPATPPTLLFHGGQDQLVLSQNLIFLDQRLTAVGVPHQSIFIGYAQHGFDFNFNGWGSQIAQPIMLDFLRRALDGGGERGKMENALIKSTADILSAVPSASGARSAGARKK